MYDATRPRDPNDGWAEGPQGKFWGKGGAAGLLAHDPDRGVLLQLRSIASHHGRTWGLPGGARHVGEDAISGALREADEEASVPADALVTRFTATYDVGYWTYTTVGFDVTTPFEPHVNDRESDELRWVKLDDVERLELHPGFAASWPHLRDRLRNPARLIVDAANVIGSRPNGWWRDRAGAATNLIDAIDHAHHDGALTALFTDDPAWRHYPQTTVVIEGAAKQSTATPQHLDLTRAARDGDQAIVEETERRRGDVVVVTADNELRRRVRAAGATTRGPQELLRLLAAETTKPGHE